ncbi:hypothetical protein [Nocardia sp. NPDC004260]
MTTGGFLYRVQIVEYPKGALAPSRYNPEYLYPDPDWAPEGWDPDPEWIERFGRDTGAAFFWPKTDKEFKSRSSARKLKQLIESYGAKAIIQRSAEIVWPEDGQEHVR